MALSSTLGTHRGHRPFEGELSQRFENRAARVPTVSFIGLAAGSIIASAILQFFTARRDMANFIAMWVPSFLAMAVFNKLIKLESQDNQGIRRIA